MMLPSVLAAIAASASRGLIERATSIGVVPRGTIFSLPSGSSTRIVAKEVFSVDCEDSTLSAIGDNLQGIRNSEYIGIYVAGANT
jgi:hypothetical protein